MLGRQGSCEAVISEIAVDFKIFDCVCMNPERASDGGMLRNCRQNNFLADTVYISPLFERTYTYAAHVKVAIFFFRFDRALEIKLLIFKAFKGANVYKIVCYLMPLDATEISSAVKC